jgi:hypothetical protein
LSLSPSLNRTAAEIAAAALVEGFPDVELLGGGPTSVGFSYDFYFPHPMPHLMETLLEERMRQIARERRPIRVLEMVPVSAKEFLIQGGRSSRVSEIDGTASLVEIIQIGSFIDLSASSHLKNSHELSAFKLWPIEKLEKGEYRLSGCAFFRKDELNHFLKNLRAYEKLSHMAVGEKERLWKIWEGDVLWLQEGLKKREEFSKLLKMSLFKDSLEISLPGAEDRVKLHAALMKEIKPAPFSIAESYWEFSDVPWDAHSGLFSRDSGEIIQVSFYPSSDHLAETFISSLQLVGKTLNILGFKYDLCLMGPTQSDKGFQRFLKLLQGSGEEFKQVVGETDVSRIDYLVEDRLGRKWAALNYYLVEKGFYVIGSTERLFAFLLEKSI